MTVLKTSASPNRHRKARILVVEDNEDHTLLIKNALQHSFTDVEAVMMSDEHTAIHYLEECAQTGLRLPQLILLDLYLPNRENGWAFLELVKKLSPEMGQIPVVVFSSSSNDEDIAESYDRGVASYVVKPMNFAEWTDYFLTLKEYWWETVSLPNTHSMY
ncbi:response regulator [Larkinella humicola]|uniref:Response regulator n=1 Tax=Larkinella humicola TaxID=2607654 RepID=A0A5N1JBR7_9BACT|nr:response regulator [Larkinella humicola]KAA9349183.1 response regulator [Larkinella humicola]